MANMRITKQLCNFIGGPGGGSPLLFDYVL